MVDFPYDEMKSPDYNYEAGYLAGLRAILRLMLHGQGIENVSACIKEQVQLMESYREDDSQ